MVLAEVKNFSICVLLFLFKKTHEIYARLFWLSHLIYNLPLQYLKEELSRIDENWIAPRFDSLPHVVHILTSKDREGEIQYLKDQSEIVEEVVDEVVHAYHGGFNKAIQNYSHVSHLLFFIIVSLLFYSFFSCLTLLSYLNWIYLNYIFQY